MKPSRVAEVLEHVLDTRWPAFLWGAPGVGKSSVVQQVAEKREARLLDIRAALLDPTDLRGIPAVVDGAAVWCPPDFLPSDPNSHGILFFDELSAAPPLVQASLYQLTLDRRLGDYQLPDGWRIIAAGNRAQDSSVVFRMPAALSNRFIHIDFEADVGDWRAWAIGADVHPLILGFIGLRPSLLIEEPRRDGAFATPRSWEMASDILKQFEAPEAASDLLLGTVGEGAGLELIGYIESTLREEDILEIIENPEDAALPDGLGDQHALISYITSNVGASSVMQAAGTLANRLDVELGVLLIRDVLRVAPGFMSDPGCARFLDEHGDLLL